MNRGGYHLTEVLVHELRSWDDTGAVWILTLSCNHKQRRRVPYIKVEAAKRWVGWVVEVPALRVRCYECAGLPVPRVKHSGFTAASRKRVR